MKTTKEKRIEISDIPFAEQSQYKWVKEEKMQHSKDGKTWTQKCKCAKTGKLGIRRGFFLTFSY